MEAHQRDPICRVCRNPAKKDAPLFCPCRCSGSMKYIHQPCLDTWLKYSRKKECEICLHRFVFESLYSNKSRPIYVKIIILKVVLVDFLTLIKKITRFLLAFIIWAIITPYSAQCIRTFYFSPSAVFKMFSALLCKYNSNYCRVFLVATQNPDLLDLLPNLKKMLFFITNKKFPHIFNENPTFLNNTYPTVMSDTPQAADKLLAETINTKLSPKVILYDVIYGYAIILALLISALAVNFIKEHFFLYAQSEGGNDANTYANAEIDASSNYHVSNIEQHNDINVSNNFQIPLDSHYFHTDVNNDTRVLSHEPAFCTNPTYPLHQIHKPVSITELGMQSSIESKSCSENDTSSESKLYPDNDSSSDNDSIYSYINNDYNKVSPTISSSSSSSVLREDLDPDLPITHSNGLDYMYFSASNENFENDLDSNHYALLGILGVRGSITNLFKNFIFTNIVIATFVGGVMWVPYYLSNLLTFLFKEILAPVLKYIGISIHSLIFPSLPKISPLLKYLHKILSPTINLAKNTNIINISNYSLGPSTSDPAPVVNLIRANEKVLDSTLKLISQDPSLHVLKKIVIDGSGNLIGTAKDQMLNQSPNESTAANHVANMHLSNILRTGGTVVTVLVKKVVTLLLIFFHLRRAGWLGQSQHLSAIQIVKKSFDIIIKFLEIILTSFISIIALPIAYGVIADLLTPSVFGATATLKKRWYFFVENPLTAKFIYWVVGTALMSSFVYYFSLVKLLLRPGVLWFVKDPLYYNTGNVSNEIINQPFSKKILKACLSAAIYAIAIIMCLGGFVFAVQLWDAVFSIINKGGGPLQIWPLQWDYSDGPLMFPIDLILFYFFSVKLVRKLKLLSFFGSYVSYWFHKAGEILELSSFLFGEDQLTLVKENQSGVFKQEGKMRTEESCKLGKCCKNNRYTYMRVPATDMVSNIPGESTYLTFSCYHEMCNYKHEKSHIFSNNWTIVRIPPYFKLRIVVLVIANWISNVFLLLLISATVLAVGRYTFNILFEHFGNFIKPDSIINSIVKITLPANPLKKELKNDNFSFPDDVTSMSHVHKSVLISLIVDLINSDHWPKEATTINEATSGILKILNKTNGVYRISNFSLINKPLWNRIIRPDLAVHDTYSFLAGVHICVVSLLMIGYVSKIFKFTSSSIYKSIVSTISDLILWVIMYSIEKVLGIMSILMKNSIFRFLGCGRPKIAKNFLRSIKLYNADIRISRKNLVCRLKTKKGAFFNVVGSLYSYSVYRSATIWLYKTINTYMKIAMRLIFFLSILLVVPTLVGFAFDSAVLGSLTYLLRTFFNYKYIISIAKIPGPWLISKKKTEILIYVVMNEWGFGAIFLNIIYMILASSRTPSVRNSSLQLMSMNLITEGILTSFIRKLAIPTVIVSIAAIIAPSIIKFLFLKILFTWIVILKALFSFMRTGGSVEEIVSALNTYLFKSLSSEDNATKISQNRMIILDYLFTISLLLFTFVLSIMLYTSFKIARRYINKVKQKAYDQVFLIGCKLHNFDHDKTVIKNEK